MLEATQRPGPGTATASSIASQEPTTALHQYHAQVAELVQQCCASLLVLSRSEEEEGTRSFETHHLHELRKVYSNALRLLEDGSGLEALLKARLPPELGGTALVSPSPNATAGVSAERSPAAPDLEEERFTGAGAAKPQEGYQIRIAASATDGTVREGCGVSLNPLEVVKAALLLRETCALSRSTHLLGAIINTLHDGPLRISALRGIALMQLVEPAAIREPIAAVSLLFPVHRSCLSKATDDFPSRRVGKTLIKPAISAAKSVYKLESRLIAFVSKHIPGASDETGTVRRRSSEKLPDDVPAQLQMVCSDFGGMQAVRSEFLLACLYSLGGDTSEAIRRGRKAVRGLSSLCAMGTKGLPHTLPTERETAAVSLLILALHNLALHLAAQTAANSTAASATKREGKDGVSSGSERPSVVCSPEKEHGLFQESLDLLELAASYGREYLGVQDPLVQHVEEELKQRRASLGGGLSSTPTVASPAPPSFTYRSAQVDIPFLPIVPHSLFSSGATHPQANSGVPLTSSPPHGSVFSHGVHSDASSALHICREVDSALPRSAALGPDGPLPALLFPGATRAQGSLPVFHVSKRSDLVASRSSQAAPRLWSGARSTTRKSVRSFGQRSVGLRFCHRLQNPADAFHLAGAVEDAVIIDPHVKAQEQLKKMEQKAERASKRLRSFLPEDIIARQKKLEEKEKRMERRMQHQAKIEAIRLSIEQGEVAPDALEQYTLRRQRHKQHKIRQLQQQQTQNLPISIDATPSSEASVRYGVAKGDVPLADPASSLNVARSCDGISSSLVAIDCTDGEDGRAVCGEVMRNDAPVPHLSTDRTDDHQLRTATDAEEGDDLDISVLSLSTELSSSCASEREDEEETTQERKERYQLEMLSYYSKMYERRSKAACVLQRAWRCSRARLELYNRQQTLYHCVYIQQKAATMCIIGFLQSIVQQRKRRQLREERAVAAAKRATVERAQLRGVRVISNAVARWLKHKHEREELRRVLDLRRDERLRQYEVAAVLVQRWWRIVPAQRAYWIRRNAEVQEELRQRRIQEHLDQSALRIQRLVRGVLGRREARRYKIQHEREVQERQRRLTRCIDLVQFALREYALRQDRLQREAQAAARSREEAAEVIQAGYRAALERRLFDRALGEARRLRLAAERIQRCWRRYEAGRERRYLRRLQQTALQDRIDDEFRWYRATLTVQSFGRLVVAKTELRRRRADVGRRTLRAIFLLQRVAQGGRSRVALGERLAEACVAQLESARQKQREVQVIGAYIQARASYKVMERRQVQRRHNKLHLRRMLQDEMRKDAAALTIQNVVRRWLTRRRMEEDATEAAIVQQTLLERITMLQAVWRGYAARRERRNRAHLVAVLAARRELLEEAVADAQHERMINTGHAPHTTDEEANASNSWGSLYNSVSDNDA